MRCNLLDLFMSGALLYTLYWFLKSLACAALRGPPTDGGVEDRGRE